MPPNDLGGSVGATSFGVSDRYASHDVRLSIREWAGVLVVLIVVALGGGRAGRLVDRFDPGADYRLPYALNDDYWLYERFCQTMAARGRTLVVGDSVVWGQYVTPDATLTHFLNRRAGVERFVNAGLDGLHPMALDGLLARHCGSLSGRAVVLHLNLLWLSSPEADLQVRGERPLNHPRLAPQFTGRPPAYDASLTSRLGVVVTRSVPVFGWARHLQIAYFDHADLPHWTVAHPYGNPLSAFARGVPDPGSDRPARAETRTIRAAAPRDLPWVPLDRSLQWTAFTRTVTRLQSNGARLRVVIGPLNEHLLTEADVRTYRALVAGAASWLRGRSVPHDVPPVLAAERYADLSHPTAEGYAALSASLDGSAASGSRVLADRSVRSIMRSIVR